MSAARATAPLFCAPCAIGWGGSRFAWAGGRGRDGRGPRAGGVRAPWPSAELLRAARRLCPRPRVRGGPAPRPRGGRGPCAALPCSARRLPEDEPRRRWPWGPEAGEGEATGRGVRRAEAREPDEDLVGAGCPRGSSSMELVDMVGIGSWSLFFFDWRLDWFMELVFGWRPKAVAEILLRILESSTQPSSGSRPPSRCLPKVEDEADEWDPLGSERSQVRGSVGPSCQRGGGKRGTNQRGRKDISHDPADCAPTCHASVACHVSQSGKNVGAAAT